MPEPLRVYSGKRHRSREVPGSRAPGDVGTAEGRLSRATGAVQGTRHAPRSGGPLGARGHLAHGDPREDPGGVRPGDAAVHEPGAGVRPARRPRPPDGRVLARGDAVRTRHARADLPRARPPAGAEPTHQRRPAAAAGDRPGRGRRARDDRPQGGGEKRGGALRLGPRVRRGLAAVSGRQADPRPPAEPGRSRTEVVAPPPVGRGGRGPVLRQLLADLAERVPAVDGLPEASGPPRGRARRAGDPGPDGVPGRLPRGGRDGGHVPGDERRPGREESDS